MKIQDVSNRCCISLTISMKQIIYPKPPNHRNFQHFLPSQPGFDSWRWEVWGGFSYALSTKTCRRWKNKGWWNKFFRLDDSKTLVKIIQPEEFKLFIIPSWCSVWCSWMLLTSLQFKITFSENGQNLSKCVWLELQQLYREVINPVEMGSLTMAQADQWIWVSLAPWRHLQRVAEKGGKGPQIYVTCRNLKITNKGTLQSPKTLQFLVGIRPTLKCHSISWAIKNSSVQKAMADLDYPIQCGTLKLAARYWNVCLVDLCRLQRWLYFWRLDDWKKKLQAWHCFCLYFVASANCS